jgi:UDP-glucose 4-epimerase
MVAKRVLVTGISGFLGASIAAALEGSDEVGHVVGVGPDEPPIPLAQTEFVRSDMRSALIHKILTSSAIDTVVHADLTSSSSRVGGRSAQKERNVIGTMQLLGACQRAEGVKKIVVRSSTAVYGSDPTHPSILEEAWSAAGQLEGYSKDVSDAETLARDFGRRRPDVTLTILRMANVVGPRAETNMTQLFSLPVIPVAFGFDPRLQLLHEDDAFEIIRRSVLEDHPGVFNVAADGVIYLSQAIRMARRLPVPILGPLGIVAGDFLRRVGVVDFPADQLSLVIHGRVVDTQRMKKVFGFEPKYSTREAFQDFIQSRGEEILGPRGLTEWQKALYERALDVSSQWS